MSVQIDMHDYFSGDKCLHAVVRKLLQKACKRISSDSRTGPEKLFRSRLKTEGKWPKREHLTTLQRWSAAEAEHRNPAFHIKLKIKAWELFKGCSFVCVTVLRKAQTKISFFSSFFFFCKLNLQPANMEVVDQSQTGNTPLLSAVKALYVSVFIWGKLPGLSAMFWGLVWWQMHETQWSTGNWPEC